MLGRFFSNRKLLILVQVLCATLWLIPHFSEAISPLRDSRALVGAAKETLHQVVGARVLIADYALLRKDFPALVMLSEDEIDAWLVDQTSYVTEGQVNAPTN